MSDDQRAKPRALSGGVDRLFRFGEMLALTALFSTIVSLSDPQWTLPVTFAGSFLATYYLIEPAVDRIGMLVMGHRPTRYRVVAAGAVFGLSVVVAGYLITPRLIGVPILITKTISFTR